MKAGSRANIIPDTAEASLNVRFRKPVPLESPIVVRGRVTWQRRSALGVEGNVLDENGTLLAHAEGTFVSRGRLDAADDRRNPSFAESANPP